MKMYININKLLHIACFSMIGSLFAAEDISQYPIIELPFVEEEEIAVDPKGLGTSSTLPAEVTILQIINELDYASILKLSQTSKSFRDLITTNPVVRKLIEEKKNAALQKSLQELQLQLGWIQNSFNEAREAGTLRIYRTRLPLERKLILFENL